MAECLVFDCLCKRSCILLVHEEQKTIHKIKTSALWVNYGALWWSSAGLTGLAESQETEIFSHVESCVSSSSVILLPVLNKSLLVQGATSQQGRGPMFSSEPPWLFYLNQLIFFVCFWERVREKRERQSTWGTSHGPCNRAQSFWLCMGLHLPYCVIGIISHLLEKIWL